MEDRRRMGRGGGMWRKLRERLGINKGMGCCGSSWAFPESNRVSTLTEPEYDDPPVAAELLLLEEEEEEEYQEGVVEVEEDVAAATIPNQPEQEEDNRRRREDSSCLDHHPITATAADAEMNLATALAAERHFRAITGRQEEEEWEVVGTPQRRVSLMRLLVEEGDEEEEEKEAWWYLDCCCVCMGRRKGAAFIPCGHTFCRVCSRELWLNRGSCPLCNRSIHQILDIF